MSEPPKLTKPFQILRLIRSASPELQDQILSMLTSNSVYERRYEAAQSMHPESKGAKVVELMRRPGGATMEEALQATGWPTISMRYQAERAGYMFFKHGERYFALENRPQAADPFRAE